jgi:hypothetical protein
MDKINNASYQSAISQIDVGATHIQQLFDYYHQCYVNSDWACVFMEQTALIPDDLKEHSFPGLCTRSLVTRVASRRTLDGGAIRGRLQQEGLLLNTGGELFRGCLVFPEADDNGVIESATGYRFGKRVRRGRPAVIEWHRSASDIVLSHGMNKIQEVIHEKAHF